MKLDQKDSIPKIIHQIHIGGSELSNQEKEWQDSWKKLNPEWEHIMWDDLKIEQDLSITYPKILKNCKNYSEKSDILRFEILYQYGGLYVDTDFECLKPIDALLKDEKIVLYWQQPQKICGAFFGATKKNSDVKLLIDGLPSREQSHGGKISDCKYGPVYITEILGPKKGRPDGRDSPKKTVYPYLWYEVHRKSEDFSKTCPEAHAVHHWGGSWI